MVRYWPLDLLVMARAKELPVCNFFFGKLTGAFGSNFFFFLDSKNNLISENFEVFGFRKNAV